MSAVASQTKTGTMQAARVAAPGSIEMATVSIPEPGAGEVRVKLEGCGVCASNIPPWEGREWFSYPMDPGALGHEGWGKVDSVGEGVTDFAPGDRVAFLSSKSYAEYDIAAVDSAVKIPDSLKDQPFPGEPLGCAMNIFGRSEIKAGGRVAIVGIGFLGSLLCRLASEAGASVIALDRKESSLRIAAQMGAANTVLLDDHWRVLNEVKELTRERFCDVVVEATGKQWPLDISAELTKERGRLIIAGYHQDGLRQVNMQLWNWRGLDVINAHERDHLVYIQGIKDAVEAVAAGRLDASALYTHVMPLGELAHALNLTKLRPEGFMKALVVMED
jgi:threonine dehydrogenase-like Zn-dependent dehydrogenase